MTSAITAHPPPCLTVKPTVDGVVAIARPQPVPAWFLAGFGIVPLGVASSIAFLSPAAALVTAFSVVLFAACAIALLVLDMATDHGEA